MKISSITILMPFLASFSNAFIPNIIDNVKKCGLGIQNTRRFCIACSAIGQMSAASQNRHMRMKIACLSLISNQCCSQTSNRFLYWKTWVLTAKINIKQNKNLFSWKKLKFVNDWTFGRKLRVVRGSGSSWSWRCWSFCSSFWGIWSRRCWSFGCCSIAATRNTNSELKSNTEWGGKQCSWLLLVAVGVDRCSS